MDNRSKILTCALQLFAARGYDAVGVKEIADTAAITKPTLYHYFGNKIGLLDTILKEYFIELNKTVEKAIIYEGDLTLSLRRVVHAYFDFFKNNTIFYRMQLAMTYAPPESEPAKAVNKYNNTQYCLLENLFIKAVNNHGNLKNREKHYAATLLGMINTYITTALYGQVTLNDELVYKALHQFEHGIYS
jgi:AcrR family transcriptional regulator